MSDREVEIQCAYPVETVLFQPLSVSYGEIMDSSMMVAYMNAAEI